MTPMIFRAYFPFFIVSNLSSYVVTKLITSEVFTSLSYYVPTENKVRRLQKRACCDCSLSPHQRYNSTNAVFYAIGDVPYNHRQETKLIQQIQALPWDADFLIHVGDFKPGGGRCLPGNYSSVSAILRLSRVPVFIVPGDNEWNDCTNTDQAWTYWKTFFLRFDERWWQDYDYAVERQQDRPENFRFIWKSTLFIGLNLVGGRVHNQAEWTQRLTDEATWVIDLMRNLVQVKSIVLFGHASPQPRHNEFFEPLKVFIRDEFRKDVPVLYLNGDGHSWRVQSNYLNQKTWMRIQVRGGASEPPLRLEVVNGDGAPENVFQYDRGL